MRIDRHQSSQAPVRHLHVDTYLLKSSSLLRVARFPSCKHIGAKTRHPRRNVQPRTLPSGRPRLPSWNTIASCRGTSKMSPRLLDAAAAAERACRASCGVWTLPDGCPAGPDIGDGHFLGRISSCRSSCCCEVSLPRRKARWQMPGLACHPIMYWWEPCRRGQLAVLSRREGGCSLRSGSTGRCQRPGRDS